MNLGNLNISFAFSRKSSHFPSRQKTEKVVLIKQKVFQIKHRFTTFIKHFHRKICFEQNFSPSSPHSPENKRKKADLAQTKHVFAMLPLPPVEST
jgi:hypothetical protein